MLPLFLLLAASTMGVDRCTPGGGPAECTAPSGMVYASGTTGIPAGDGCNTCSCEDGVLGCTERACPSELSCFGPDGAIYPSGSTMPAPDGCNTCSCVDGEVTGCTDRACTPPPSACTVDGVVYPDGGTIPASDGCNTCTCLDGEVTGCTDRACAPPPAACSVFGRSYADGWAPSNDGCNTCLCDEGTVTGSCTDLACAPPEIQVCDDLFPFMSDPFVVNDVSLDAATDRLRVELSYSGGCAPHYFRLCYDPDYTMLDIDPSRAPLRVDHDGQHDMCDAFPTETRVFDLRPLRDSHRAVFGGGALEVELDGHVLRYL
ncbi:MAG: hypothetical protein AB7S26_39965 [Sandaracinaceae bacterium]